MKKSIFILFIVVVIFLFSFKAFPAGNSKNQAKAPSSFEFKTFTSAVCESKTDVIQCRDELFVNCSGKILKADEFTDCNGIKIENQKVTGAATASFSKDWKDPRN